MQIVYKISCPICGTEMECMEFNKDDVAVIDLDSLSEAMSFYCPSCEKEISIEIEANYCDEEDSLFDGRTCRVCGCTDDYACPGGCYWVEDDLCSDCEEDLLKKD